MAEYMEEELFAMNDEVIERQYQALDFRFRGGYTRRYHGLRNLYEDTVGHHSYNVAQIVRFIAYGMDPARVALLVEAALDHDVAEHIVGDMPAPTKRAIPGLREAFAVYEAEQMAKYGVECVESQLAPEEAVLLKAADSLDGMRFCIQERQMGNTLAITTYEAFASYVRALDLDQQVDGHRAYRLFCTLELQWELYNGKS